MASRVHRESLINRIAELQRQQLTMDQEAKLQGWTRKQSVLAFDTRFAHIARLMRELTKLDEGEDKQNVSDTSCRNA